MFIGHIAVGFASKRAAPKASLGDWVSHRPDLQIVPWSPVRVGLGLWNSVPATIAVESVMFVVGLVLYLKTTRAERWIGHLSLWSFVGLILLAYVADVTGPPPPSVEALRAVGLVTWAFVPWAFWIDRTREVRAAA